MAIIVSVLLAVIFANAVGNPYNTKERRTEELIHFVLYFAFFLAVSFFLIGIYPWKEN